MLTSVLESALFSLRRIYACELEREVSFTAESKDRVKSIGPLAWILNIETVDVFVFPF